ncbi:hypothetical protein Leryth_022879 [Lithospermum erythrorhizon]|nr:hypothetical protein Leryth_022879 [Lithospermum erythrorhizon]
MAAALQRECGSFHGVGGAVKAKEELVGNGCKGLEICSKVPMGNSRKMMELGYKRNPKKCREKFENVFKYHKRTKEGRSSKSEGKTYKFFDQLAALENVTTPPSQSSLHHLPPPPPPPPHSMVAQMQVVHADPISVLPPAPRATTPPNATAAQPSHHHHQEQHYTNVSSSSSSDEDMERRRKRKRKEEEYFREAMKGVIDKQEELQKKFLDILEKKERERVIREEAWRNQELERIKREYDLLAQERSMAAKRHSTLVSFLEKMTQQQNPQYSTREMNISPSLQEKTVKNQCETGFSITKDNTVVNSSLMTIYDGSTRTAAVPQPTFTLIYFHHHYATTTSKIKRLRHQLLHHNLHCNSTVVFSIFSHGTTISGNSIVFGTTG